MGMVLVTGCQGFTGQVMVRFLVSEGYRVIGLDCVPPTSASGIDVIVGDLRSREGVLRAVQQVQPQYVVHLAAITEREKTNPALLMEVNFCGTLNLLDAITRHAPDARVCVVGSSAEYGATTRNDCPIREDQPLRPVTVYAISKVAQSMAAQKAWLRGRLRVVRPCTFNLIGPGQPASLAPGAFARQVAEAEAGLRPPEIVTRRLSDYRDFVDVRDAVRAYWVATVHGEPGQVYNVCSGQAIQIRQILDVLFDSASCALTVRTNDDPDVPSEVPYQCGSHDLLSTHTGWQPRIKFEQSVRDLLDYWRQIVQNRRT